MIADRLVLTIVKPINAFAFKWYIIILKREVISMIRIYITPQTKTHLWFRQRVIPNQQLGLK